MQPHPLAANFLGKSEQNLGQFGQNLGKILGNLDKFDEILVNLNRSGQKSKSCIPRNIQSPTSCLFIYLFVMVKIPQRDVQHNQINLFLSPKMETIAAQCVNTNFRARRRHYFNWNRIS